MIDVSSYAVDIDDDKIQVEFSGFLRAFGTNNDLPEMYVEFLNVNGNLLGTSPIVSNNTPTWLMQTGYESLPISTRSLRVVLAGTRIAGTDNDSYFDTLSVRLMESSCSSVDLSDKHSLEHIKLYPNPTTGMVTLQLNQAGRFQLLDLTGKIMFEKQLTQGENVLDLNAFNGLFLYEVRNANNTHTGRILIE